MSRVAIVTGGTRGIGAAISKFLKKNGHQVAASYAGNDEAAQSFSQENDIPVYKWDVGDFEDSKSGIKRIEDDLGVCEILVNNAGVTSDGPLHKMQPEKWRRVMSVNLDSLYNMTANVINSMRKSGFGRIVNISSINGQKGQFGQTNYAATKAAAIGFTKSLALESAAKGITVNAVAPGYVNTEMVAAVPEDILGKIVSGIPAGRLGEPEEIARVVSFLASDEASYINGATISVNGAQFMT